MTLAVSKSNCSYYSPQSLSLKMREISDDVVGERELVSKMQGVPMRCGRLGRSALDVTRPL